VFNNIYRDTLVYKEYNGVNDSNNPIYKTSTNISGLRLKGQLKVTTSSDGDTTSCTIAYKTPQPLIPNSILNNRTIMECVKVQGLGYDCGYISYVK
jgi:hypothetical protein